MASPQKKYKLADLIREVEESKHKILVETDDETFEIDPPELWDDDVFAVTGGPVAEAEAIMGKEAYARFRAAGGRATLIQQLIQQRIGGATLPESEAS